MHFGLKIMTKSANDTLNRQYSNITTAMPLGSPSDKMLSTFDSSTRTWELSRELFAQQSY